MKEEVFTFTDEEVAELFKSGRMKMELAPSHQVESESVQGQIAEVSKEFYGSKFQDLPKSDRDILTNALPELQDLIENNEIYSSGQQVKFSQRAFVSVVQLRARLSSEASNLLMEGLIISVVWKSLL